MNDYDNECSWMSGGSLDEELFCKEFLLLNPMIYAGGHFYTEKGVVEDEGMLRKEIYDELCRFTRRNLAKKVDAIMAALRIVARQSKLETDENKIHLANGTYDIYEGFSETFHICHHRLPVSLTGSKEHSQIWEDFLQQLLEPEDILTLQEYMGYCLLPTTKAQKMLMILGGGGEGKSRIGVVMKAIFGSSMHVGSLSKLETNNFARSDLEDLLVLVDDDLRMDALHSTNYIKSIITADVPMEVERKYEQSYQTHLHARLMAFGNGSLEALHDRSYGFFRRQIILAAKPRDPNRVDDPYLGEKLAADRDKIFRWCLYGLYRLLEQDYQFTISEKTRQNWQQTVTEQNNIVAFMESQGYMEHKEVGAITAKRLYELYRLWCEDNALKPLSQRSFSGYLIANQHAYNIRYITNIPIADGKRARGFLGLAPVSLLTQEMG